MISHLGVKLLSVGWGAPSTLPVSPCWKMASWASPRSSVRFLRLEESSMAGSLHPGLCLAVTALTTLDTMAPGLSGRPRHRPCFRLALLRRPAELSESLEPSLLSGNPAFFCRSCCGSMWMQKRGQTALTQACFLLDLSACSSEHPCSQSPQSSMLQHGRCSRTNRCAAQDITQPLHHLKPQAKTQQQPPACAHHGDTSHSLWMG